MRLMTFDPDFYLTSGQPTGQPDAIVQECLLMSIGLVTPYSAKMPIHPKTTSLDHLSKMHLMTFDVCVRRMIWVCTICLGPTKET